MSRLTKTNGNRGCQVPRPPNREFFVRGPGPWGETTFQFLRLSRERLVPCQVFGQVSGSKDGVWPFVSPGVSSDFSGATKPRQTSSKEI